MTTLHSMKVLHDAPRDRHILGYQAIMHLVDGDYKVVGHRWEELFHHPKRGWSFWCGNPEVITTERVRVIAWAELPDPRLTHWPEGYLLGVQLDGA